MANRAKRRITRTICITMIAAACLAAGGEGDMPKSERPGEDEHEYRGAWIATVVNIDWPSESGLSTEQQKEELIGLLDLAKSLNLNVVIFQVRPACDAFYASELEPWSEYLTGVMGKAPDPYYDPLEFAVAEAHRRGLQIEAWFNPYRARHFEQRSEASADHISIRHPELVRRYGKFLWLDPGDPRVQDHTVAVVLDVVRRYEIDGVHLDDYFYPYPVKDEEGNDVPFPDEETYAAYRDGGGTLERDEWRRSRVDALVRRLHREIHAIKPGVRFGISPFGIWRPGHPEGIEGFDQVAKLHADPRKWMQEKWVDYLVPQLYWPTTQEKQAYGPLLRWWIEQNTTGRVLAAGNFTARAVEGENAWGIDEYLKQIELTRSLGAAGNVHFHLKTFQDHPELSEALVAGPYAKPSSVPPMPE